MARGRQARPCKVIGRGSHAGRGISDGLARLRCRRRDFGLAQSLSGQRHQSVLRRRRQIRRAVRESRSNSSWPIRRGSVPDGDATGRAAPPSIFASIWTMREPCMTRLDALGPVRLAVDCANGAMTAVAPALFQELGFDVTVVGCRTGRPQHQQGRRFDTSGKAG